MFVAITHLAQYRRYSAGGSITAAVVADRLDQDGRHVSVFLLDHAL